MNRSIGFVTNPPRGYFRTRRYVKSVSTQLKCDVLETNTLICPELTRVEETLEPMKLAFDREAERKQHQYTCYVCQRLAPYEQVIPMSSENSKGTMNYMGLCHTCLRDQAIATYAKQQNVLHRGDTNKASLKRVDQLEKQIQELYTNIDDVLICS